MQAIRQFMDVEQLEGVIDIPKGFTAQKVEVLVLPVVESLKTSAEPALTENSEADALAANSKLKASGFIGCFEAEPTLAENSKAEFAKIMAEKYADS